MNLEYKNEFLYFTVRSDEGRENNTIIYCSGVNYLRFLPITKGRHGLCSNPSIRGLQQLRHDISALALSHSATPIAVKGRECAGISPLKDAWYVEGLVIENAPLSLPEEIINYAPLSLIKKITNACLLDVAMPDKLPKPLELQAYLDELCSKYRKAM
ncbi:MAG: hypothetical protein HY756_01065 [Nitrospirae bacterium]|nr:hypothetical protein [Nitrospirota bacterium]